MIHRAFFRAFSLAVLLVAGLAHAQQYRWIDKDGSVKYTDAPPPAWAKDVRRIAVTATQPAAPQIPFELARLQKDFPVTLYTSPACKEHCENARAALNRRGVPFKEVQVWDKASNEELKNVSGELFIPTLLVGRTAHRGFEQEAFDALLDSADYPKAGVMPVLSQKAPPPPEGYVPVGESAAPKPAAEATKAVTQPKAGPYDPSGLAGPPPRPGQYDPSGLTGPPPRPGQYAVPAESK